MFFGKRLASHFEVKQVGRFFCRIFRDSIQILGIFPRFSELLPGLSTKQDFWSALAAPAPPPSTPLVGASHEQDVASNPY